MLAPPQPDTFAFKPTTNPPDSTGLLVEGAAVALGVVVVALGAGAALVVEVAGAVPVLPLATVAEDDGAVGAAAAGTVGVDTTGAVWRTEPRLPATW